MWSASVRSHLFSFVQQDTLRCDVSAYEMSDCVRISTVDKCGKWTFILDGDGRDHAMVVNMLMRVLDHQDKVAHYDIENIIRHITGNKWLRFI